MWIDPGLTLWASQKRISWDYRNLTRLLCFTGALDHLTYQTPEARYWFYDIIYVTSAFSLGLNPQSNDYQRCTGFGVARWPDPPPSNWPGLWVEAMYLIVPKENRQWLNCDLFIPINTPTIARYLFRKHGIVPKVQSKIDSQHYGFTDSCLDPKKCGPVHH